MSKINFWGLTKKVNLIVYTDLILPILKWTQICQICQKKFLTLD